MARNWEEWLKTASGSASPTEEAERDRTEERIRNAIRKAVDLPASVKIYAKGSYANNTNVRQDSDVDIAVEWTEQFYVNTWGETAGLGSAELGYMPADIAIAPYDFRQRVERAVIGAFGEAVVNTTGDKAIKVVRGTASLDADVVPCFSLRRYEKQTYFEPGHRIFSKGSGFAGWVDNFPDQHKRNSNAKNSATGRRYKEIVRCLKRLEGELVADKHLPREYPGYLIECLLYNVPNDRFRHPRRFDDLNQSLIWLYETLSDPARVGQLLEASQLLFLFQGYQGRIPENARNFVYLAWNRLQDNI